MVVGSTPVRRPISVRSHRRSIILVWLVGLILATGGMAALAAEDDADYGVRPAPVGDGSRPIDRIEHALEPGTSITDAIEIFNFGDHEALFDVYAADMVPSSNGGLAPAARETPIAAGGAWLTPHVETVELGPGDWASLDFDIDVPAEASVGPHTAVLLVERRESPGQGMVDLKTRIGLLVEVEVLTEIELVARLGPITLERINGDVVFYVPVTNTGEVTFEVTGEVLVRDDYGRDISRIALAPADKYVAPGEKAVFSAEWENPPLFGHFQALSTVEATVGERVPVVFDGGPVDFWLVPWMWILVVLVTLLVVGGALTALRPAMKRRGRHRREEREILRQYRRRRALEEQPKLEKKDETVGL
jgi:hypothetical protein